LLESIGSYSAFMLTGWTKKIMVGWIGHPVLLSIEKQNGGGDY